MEDKNKRFLHFIERVKERYNREISLKECELIETDIINVGQGLKPKTYKPIFINHRFRTETWYVFGLFILFRDNGIRTVIEARPALYKKAKKIKQGYISSKPEARNIAEQDEFSMFQLLMKEKYNCEVSRHIWEKWCDYIKEASNKTMKYYTNPHCIRVNRKTRHKNMTAYRISEKGMPPIVLGLYKGAFHQGAIIPLPDPMDKNSINIQEDLRVKKNEILAKHAGHF